MLSLFSVGTTIASETTEQETTKKITSKLPGEHIFHIMFYNFFIWDMVTEESTEAEVDIVVETTAAPTTTTTEPFVLPEIPETTGSYFPVVLNFDLIKNDIAS